MGKGSLDYDEFVIDSSNKKSKPYQIRDCMADAIKELREENETLKIKINNLKEDICCLTIVDKGHDHAIELLYDDLDDLLRRSKWVCTVFSAVFAAQFVLILLQALGVI